jgi:hypothetical protein
MKACMLVGASLIQSILMRSFRCRALAVIRLIDNHSFRIEITSPN